MGTESKPNLGDAPHFLWAGVNQRHNSFPEARLPTKQSQAVKTTHPSPAKLTPQSIPVKTPQGLAELATRHHGLSQRHRTVMFLVDGKRSVAQVQSMASAAGAPEALLSELLSLGLVSLREPVNDASSVWVTMPKAPHDSLVAKTDIPLNDSLLPNSLLPNLTPQPVSAEQSTAEPPQHLPVLNAVIKGHTMLQTSAPDAFLEAGHPLHEARDMLSRALMEQAPVAGSMTRMRLKRAKSIAEVACLMGEVEQHLSKPHRHLLTQQLLSNVKQLLILAGSR